MAMKIGLWIGRIIATVIIASLLSIWTTSFIVTSYVQKMLEQYEIPLEVESVAISDVWRSLWSTKKEPDRELASGDASIDSTGQLHDAANRDNTSTDAHAEEHDEDQHMQESTTDPLHEEEAWDQPAQEVLAPVEGNSEPTISPEDIETSKDQLALEDKERAFGLLMSKLPTDAWQMISTYMEDGLTDAELLEVQQVMALHLSKDEYEELLTILDTVEE